ncbi:MAG: hypothetical protein A2289_20955 [Deltaproteobacteria bacterium RIFOXYA12_FULL_58_15]|nr:MAG: hypothetical protein A2289_20955 [Deltaproteobacteria bacterium RIFOXYA12_FULL_58_15]
MDHPPGRVMLRAGVLVGSTPEDIGLVDPSREASISVERVDSGLRIDLGVALATLIALAGTIFLIRAEIKPPATLAEDAAQIGQVGQVLGTAKRRSVSSLSWEALAAGRAIRQGDGVFVTEDSSVALDFADGSRLMVSESSLVVVELPNRRDESPHVAVRHGSVAGQAGERGLRIAVGDGVVDIGKASVASVVDGGTDRVEVSVEKGDAIIHGEGKSVELGEHHQAVIVGRHVSSPVELPIELVEPPLGTSIFYQSNTAVVNFVWRGGPDEVALDLADDAAFSRIIRTERVRGNRKEIGGLNSGAYVWRLRTVDGEVLSPTRSLVVERDAAPVVVRPLQGEIINVGRARRPLTFVWTVVTGVERYRFEMGKDRSFQNITIAREVDGTQLQIEEPLDEALYFWRVRSLAVERKDSPYSAISFFMLAFDALPRAPNLIGSEVEIDPGTDTGPDMGPDDTAEAEKVPAANPDDTRTESEPTKAAPADPGGETGGLTVEVGEKMLAILWCLVGGVAHAASDASAAIVLRWEAVDGVSSYVIEIAEDEAFSRVVVRQEVSASYFRWQKISKRSYWWRVISVDGNGRKGPPSAPRSFGAVLTKPSLAAPAHDAVFSIAAHVPPVSFSWDTQLLASTYEWVIAGDPGFKAVVATERTRLPSLTWSAKSAGPYYWRVRAADAAGSFTPFSSVRKLTMALQPPEVVSPAPELQVALTEPPPVIDFVIEKVATASDYTIEIFAANQPAGVGENYSVQSTSWQWQPVAAGTYHWRSRSVSGKMGSAWSPPRKIVVTLTSPRLTEPAPDAELHFRSPESETWFAWDPVPGANGYHLVIAEEGKEVVSKTVASERLGLPGLPAGSYEVSVRAQSAGGNTSEPTMRAFSRVALPPIEVPVVETSQPDPEVMSRSPLFDSTFQIGVGAGFTTNFASAVSPALAAEFGYRLPLVDGRVVAAVRLEYHYNVEAGAGSRVTATQQVLPMAFGARVELPPVVIPTYGWAGVLVGVLFGRIDGAGPSLQRTMIGVGGEAGIGARYDIGPGSAFVELRYSWLRSADEFFELDGGGLTSAIGYRFDL